MLNKIIKKIFYFLGSVKLAVPSMLTLALVIACGTIIESRYNAEYAKLLIYKNPLFSALLIMIWTSVLFATLTRLPWKRHHIGFLITHLGLLLIFGGGFLTNNFGVDGTLRIPEGQSSNFVMLQDMVVSARSGGEARGVEFDIPKYMSEKGESTFSAINEGFRGLAVVRGYMPFAEVKEVLKSDPNAKPLEPFEIQFRIKSAFFNVQQNLNSQTQKQLQMGPAVFRLLKAGENPRKPNSVVSAKKAVKHETATESKVQRMVSAEASAGKSILNVKLGSTEKHIDLSNGKPKTISVGSYKIVVKEIFSHASVVSNGLQDNPEAPINPALVVEVTDGKETARDVLFAKFPKFSLRKGKFADLELSYSSDSVAGSSEDIMAHGSAGGGGANHAAEAVAGSPAPSENANAPEPPPMMGGASSGPNGNEVQIYYSPDQPKRVLVQLWKAGKKVEEKYVTEGESFQTPWMGMVLTAEKIAWNGQKEIQVQPTEPQEKTDSLPPAALKIGRFDGAPSEEFWMPEGEERSFSVDGKEYFVYFGRKVIELPFTVDLKSFKKTDYPGTTTPKAYESHVQVTGSFLPITISMNEPLQMKGYTLYQASYEPMGDGKFASIFSVNYDPGRPFKYAGGIILALGIIYYTLSKSRRLKELGLKL